MGKNDTDARKRAKKNRKRVRAADGKLDDWDLAPLAEGEEVRCNNAPHDRYNNGNIPEDDVVPL